jgi:hypothetical protein
MLMRTISLMGYTFAGLDGEMGKVEDFYFDDRHWAIRYLVAFTGEWISFRQVLISPHAILAVDTARQKIDVKLSRKQIEESPPLGSAKPVSRQFEEAYHSHFGWPGYWIGPHMWGEHAYPARDGEKRQKVVQAKETWDPNLRSTRAVTGHSIQAVDGEIGHVDDFLIDDETWAIRYLIISTGTWWPGKSVLVSTQWIEQVSWPESKVFVDLSRETIKRSPKYTNDSLPTRSDEATLHQHYKRQGYWTG